MHQSTCNGCSASFMAKRSDSRFCSRSCAAKAQRLNNARTCDIPGCDRPHGARGMCYSHYSAWHRSGHGRTSNGSKFEIVCTWCGSAYMSSRREGKYCSDDCKGRSLSQMMRTKCALPSDHPVILLIAKQAAAQREQRAADKELTKAQSLTAWRTPRECPGCACEFTPLYTPNAICCSKSCSARCARRRRRAREHGALGSWTWSEFMRIARKFGYCCAYCDTKPDRLDPDHVVPLSRGGMDSPSNLLPTCMLCNSSKCAMTLAEWTEWLAQRGMPPRMTSWTSGDARYVHLTQALLLNAA